MVSPFATLGGAFFFSTCTSNSLRELVSRGSLRARPVEESTYPQHPDTPPPILGHTEHLTPQSLYASPLPSCCLSSCSFAEHILYQSRIRRRPAPIPSRSCPRKGSVMVSFRAPASPGSPRQTRSRATVCNIRGLHRGERLRG